jgi:hypothetical protein
MEIEWFRTTVTQTCAKCGRGAGRAASGILESSPMGTVGCVRCERLDGAEERARASLQNSTRDLLMDFGSRVSGYTK